MNNNRRRNFRSRQSKNNFRRRNGSIVSNNVSNNFNGNGNINFNRNGTTNNIYVVEKAMQKYQQLAKDAQSNGDPVLSQKLKLPSGKVLKGEKRKEFELERIKIDLKLSDLRWTVFK